MRLIVCSILIIVFVSCQKNRELNHFSSDVSLIVLGTVQDGGSPHIGCAKDCCKDLFENPDPNRKVVSLGLIDKENQKSFMFDATPDFPEQMKMLSKLADYNLKETPNGIFLTHAHIGHYTGLMFLGKEAMGADKVPVYAMPEMGAFLKNNGPWSQLVSQNNIVLEEIDEGVEIKVTTGVSIIPLIVPHRDEFSETVGYNIIGPNKSALFIPDIDKWQKWDRNIVEEINKVNYAFIDATFFDSEEVNHRDISEIPHPFFVESMDLFKDLSQEEKAKVYFIHLNHTNPVLDPDSPQSKHILEEGYHIARINSIFPL